MVDELGGGELIDVELMNEYSADIPLWFQGALYEDNELGLSAELLAELRAFAERWERNVDPAAFDARFDSIPVVRELVDLWRALVRLSRPVERRADRLENLAMRRTGETLRHRLQLELGARYRVRYVHS